VSRPTVRAAGGVVWRQDPAAPEVALVHRPEYDDWSLPKGKAKAGEHLLVTAVREIAEETGCRARIGPFLTTVRYRVVSGGRPANKEVTYWSMRCVGGEFEASREVDELRWLPVADARQTLTTASDRAVLDTFEGSPRDTVPLLLLRHASTGASSRPLDRTGRDRAAGLVPVFESLAVTDLFSADLPACTETLAPFAEASGLTVHRDGALTLAGLDLEDRDVADEVRQRASGSSSMVVCGSQGVITGLLQSLGKQAEVRPPHDTAVKKGGWWLLHHRGGAVTSYERHEPAA
jgi:8-oxo-dGTP pyrophosphatase MutT (NUDIX family)/broad specificity phosphatase PhoE